jgi:hypothetical protein
MLAKNLQITEFVAEAQLVVRLELVAVVRPTDTLQIFPAVRIPCPQLPNEPDGNDVIHMAPRSRLLEIETAGLYLAVSFQGRHSMLLPAPPIRGCTWPFPVHTFPMYRLLLRPKSRLAKLTPTIAISFAAAIQNSRDFRLPILAVGTTHGEPPYLSNNLVENTAVGSGSGKRRVTQTSSLELRGDQELGYAS